MKVTNVNQPAYRVELTAQEARVLYEITRSIGGSPDGPRGVVDQLAKGLIAAGVRPLARCPFLMSGAIMIEDK